MTTRCGRYEVTPPVTAGAYASGNCIGGLMSFVMPGTFSGLVQSLSVQFIGGATTSVVAYLFDSNPTGSTFTDHGTFTIAAADEAKRINKVGITLTPVANTGDTATGAAIDNYAKPFAPTDKIWAAFVAGGTFTPASTTDMRVSLGYAQDGP